MKICITGANGFLGSWTSRVLSEDFEVFSIIRENSNQDNLIPEPAVHVISEKTENWSALINDINPQALIMLDWQGVGNLQRNDLEQHTNIKRIQSFVKELRQLELIIGVGSQAELGAQRGQLLEDQIEKPTTEYGKAKQATREMLFKHFKGSRTKLKWARIFSTYGALDTGNWLIPNLIRSLNQDKEFDLTEGSQIWSYLHAYDAALGFRQIILGGEPGIYNFGNPKTNLIRDVCTELASIMGKDSKLLKFGAIPMRSDQVYQLNVSTKKLNDLNWNPKVGLREGLSHTVKWILDEPVNPLQLNNGDSYTLKR
jgi:nucleoside-diphosphate-sugar epimerase